MGSYKEIYQRASENPQEFWAQAAEDLIWQKKWQKVLDEKNSPFNTWFAGGKINTCYNALDRHVEAGSSDRVALIYDSPLAATKEKITYLELRDRVAAFSGVLKKYGVEYGDRVVIYMPMIPETVVAMLACSRIGAIHSVVFGGFASNELAKRIDDAKPKLIVSASCGLEPGKVIEYKPLLDGAISLSKNKPDSCIIFQRVMHQAELNEKRDIDWHDAHNKVTPADCVEVEATDPVYILYTSGTTGVPKGVVRPTAGHLVSLKWSMKNIYGVDPGEVYWAASDVGWVVGHSYIVYAPLFHGCTTVLYEGKPVGTPDAGAFWRVISEHQVACMFTAPTAIRAIKKEDPDGKLIREFKLDCLKSQFLAGERCDPDTLEWTEKMLKVPVVDHWWQTETGWPIASNCLGIELLDIKPGSPTCAVPGWKIDVLDESCKPVPPGEIGAISLKLPLPPGSLPTLWQNDKRFVDSYLTKYPGYYETGDAGIIDQDGYLHVLSRTDDIINVAGHRLSTGGMEQVLAEHQDVAECAVLGVSDQLKGQVPLGLLVLKDGVNTEHKQIIEDVIRMVRAEIGPVAAFKVALIVKRLPKTRSGKILRGIIQKIADSADYDIPATIDDPLILMEIKESLQKIGYAT
ncbi:MAG: propionyl-CoA synthetase [Rhodospirillaceae bacterium]|nr:propionyl-CoA synthetase [Rhodospirillaceae bacterium]